MDYSTMLYEYLKKQSVFAGVRESFDKDSASGEITITSVNHYYIRDHILGLGTILEEGPEGAYYITTIKLGLGGWVLAYALLVHDKDKVHIVSYAREGLIRRGLAQKAIAVLTKVLT